MGGRGSNAGVVVMAALITFLVLRSTPVTVPTAYNAVLPPSSVQQTPVTTRGPSERNTSPVYPTANRHAVLPQSNTTKQVFVVPKDIFRLGNPRFEQLRQCGIRLDDSTTGERRAASSSAVPLTASPRGNNTVVERVYPGTLPITSEPNPSYILSNVCFRDGHGAFGSGLIDNRTNFFLPKDFTHSCEPMTVGHPGVTRFCYRDDANVAFAVEMQEQSDMAAKCYHDTVAIVQLWNPFYHILNYNMYHIALKVQSLMIAADRVAKDYTIAPTVVLLQTGRVNAGKMDHKVAPLLEFLLPVVSKRHFGVRKVHSDPRFTFDMSKLDTSLVCFRRVYFGFDPDLGINAETLPFHVAMGRRLRDRVATRYPYLGLRSNRLQYANGSYVPTRVSRNPFGRTGGVRGQSIVDRNDSVINTCSTANLTTEVTYAPPQTVWQSCQTVTERTVRVTVVTRRDVARRTLIGAEKLTKQAACHLKKFVYNILHDLPFKSTMRCSRITVTVTTVVIGSLSVEEQARLAAATDIFVAVHGMALAWTMMMPPGSVVVELSNYYRFGRNNGLNMNCHTIYGGYVSRFEHHHLLYFKPQPNRATRRSSSDSKGGRNYDVAVNSKPWIALMEAALCVWLNSPTDNALIQSKGTDDHLTRACHISDIPNESQLAMNAKRTAGSERCVHRRTRGRKY